MITELLSPWLRSDRGFLLYGDFEDPVRFRSNAGYHGSVLPSSGYLCNRSSRRSRRNRGIITGILKFDSSGTALMLTIFALQDSFGTACNVTGDGALTLMLTGYAKRHHIEEQQLDVEL